MPRANANGIEIEYDTIGDPGDPAILLVMGFTGQMTTWDERFTKLLAAGGYHVIRFDNRDCGLSTHLDGVAVDAMAALMAQATGGPLPDAPYLLSDMGNDAIGLLDALGIERAHIVGVSMGGMIAQQMAIDHPSRVATLTSIMSTTGEAEYGQPDPEVLTTFLTPPPTEREAYIEQFVTVARMFSSKRYYDPVRTARVVGDAYDRSFYPEGGPRQLVGIIASGSRAEGLAQLDVPTLVIHGRDDRLVLPSGGERTAELVPGSAYLFVSDMGHDLPEPLWPFLTDAILANTARA